MAARPTTRYASVSNLTSTNQMVWLVARPAPQLAVPQSTTEALVPREVFSSFRFIDRRAVFHFISQQSSGVDNQSSMSRDAPILTADLSARGARRMPPRGAASRFRDPLAAAHRRRSQHRITSYIALLVLARNRSRARDGLLRTPTGEYAGAFRCSPAAPGPAAGRAASRAALGAPARR